MKLEKTTLLSPRPRWYDDACSAAHALDLVGERWALLVMRELLLGPRRFSDLRASLPGISASVLTQRLEGLEASGVLVRRKLPPPSAAQVYELTQWGYASEPIFHALGRWGVSSPLHDPMLPVSAASLMISMRAMFDPARAKGVAARIGFWLDGESYLARVAKSRITTGREAVDGADAVLSGSPSAMVAALYGKQPLPKLEAAGVLRVEGSRDAARRFAALFALPPKAAVSGAEFQAASCRAEMPSGASARSP